MESTENYLVRDEVWELELHLFKHAIEHGVEPIRAYSFGGLPTDESDPKYHAHYMARSFLFRYPPSAADFWQLVKQAPWMGDFEPEYKAIIDDHEWPTIVNCNQAAYLSLFDSQQREIGRINIRRQDVYQNKFREVREKPQPKRRNGRPPFKA